MIETVKLVCKEAFVAEVKSLAVPVLFNAIMSVKVWLGDHALFSFAMLIVLSFH
jgi:hypothetical protein